METTMSTQSADPIALANSRPPYRPIAVRSLGVVLALVASAPCALSCSSTHEAQSGETHFLRACSEECGGGLRCVGQVCTESCKRDDECSALAETASCELPARGADADSKR